MILQLHIESQKVGLKMNNGKRKVIINNYPINHEIKVDDEEIES